MGKPDTMDMTAAYVKSCYSNLLGDQFAFGSER